jgi:hypothetical protein
MKKIILLLVLAFNFILQANSQEAIKSHEISQRFSKRLILRELELRELTKECNENYNQAACKNIKKVREALKKDVLKHCTDPNSDETRLLLDFYSTAYLTREEKYDEDEKVLRAYKAKLPKDLYIFLKEYEKKHEWFHNECVVKRNIQVCKNAITEDITNPESLSYYVQQFKLKMNELKSTNELLYNFIIEYLVDSGSSKKINTKSSLLKNHQKLVEFLAKVEDLKNIKEIILDKIHIQKKLTLKEIRQALAENKDT